MSNTLASFNDLISAWQQGGKVTGRCRSARGADWGAVFRIEMIGAGLTDVRYAPARPNSVSLRYDAMCQQRNFCLFNWAIGAIV
jgi:hypothetical protein